MPITIREAAGDDAAAIANIYNQGIEDRGATFETQPRTSDDIAVKLADSASVPHARRRDDGGVVGWAG